MFFLLMHASQTHMLVINDSKIPIRMFLVRFQPPTKETTFDMPKCLWLPSSCTS